MEQVMTIYKEQILMDLKNPPISELSITELTWAVSPIINLVS